MARLPHIVGHALAGSILAVAALASAGGEAPARVEPAPRGQAPAAEPLRNAYPGGALDTACSHVGDGLGGPGYQFIATCPGRATSPDGRWAVVQPGGDAGGVTLTDAEGKLLDEIPGLNDAMPFVLHWAPKGDWFFANHYQGSTHERLRVFEIVNRVAVERSAIFADAVRTAVARYPCLGRSAQIFASGWRWSRDGRTIAMTVYARPDACFVERGPGNWVPDGDWEVLWMIGDAATGRIDPASVRVRPDGVGEMPSDGPYAEL